MGEVWKEALDKIQNKVLEKAMEFGITKQEMAGFSQLELRELYGFIDEEGKFKI